MDKSGGDPSNETQNAVHNESEKKLGILKRKNKANSEKNLIQLRPNRPSTSVTIAENPRAMDCLNDNSGNNKN